MESDNMMRYVFYKNKVVQCPDSIASNYEQLNEEQISFYQEMVSKGKEPTRQEVLSLRMNGSELLTDLSSVKSNAKQNVSVEAHAQLTKLMPDHKIMLAFSAINGSGDAQISKEVAMDRIDYYNKISKGINMEKMRIYKRIDDAKSVEEVGEAIQSMMISKIKTGEERYG